MKRDPTPIQVQTTYTVVAIIWSDQSLLLPSLPFSSIEQLFILVSWGHYNIYPREKMVRDFNITLKNIADKWEDIEEFSKFK